MFNVIYNSSNMHNVSVGHCQTLFWANLNRIYRFRPDPLNIFLNIVLQPVLELQKDYFVLSFRLTILYALFVSPYIYSSECILLDIKFQVAILVGCNLTQDCGDRHHPPLSIRGLVAISNLPNIFTKDLPFRFHALY